MEQLLLTGKEIVRLIHPLWFRKGIEEARPSERKIAQAQLKKVATDAPWKITTIGEERSVPNRTQIRFLFEDEFQSLLKEASSKAAF